MKISFKTYRFPENTGIGPAERRLAAKWKGKRRNCAFQSAQPVVSAVASGASPDHARHKRGNRNIRPLSAVGKRVRSRSFSLRRPISFRAAEPTASASERRPADKTGQNRISARRLSDDGDRRTGQGCTPAASALRAATDADRLRVRVRSVRTKRTRAHGIPRSGQIPLSYSRVIRSTFSVDETIA